MGDVLKLGFIAAALGLFSSSVLVPIAAAIHRRRRAAAGARADSRFLVGAAWLVIAAGVVGPLGTPVGFLGLLFSALWCTSPLIAAAAEVKASRVDSAPVSNSGRVLAAAIAAQAVSALTLGLLWAVSIAPGVAAGTFGESFYHLVGAQYAFSVTAVGLASAVSALRLRSAERPGTVKMQVT